MGKHGEKKFIKILMYQLTVFSNLMSCLSSFTFLLKRQLLFFRLLLVLLFSAHFVQPLTGVDVTHVELQTVVAWVVVVKFVVTVGFTNLFRWWRTGWNCKTGECRKGIIMNCFGRSWTRSLDMTNTGWFGVILIWQGFWWRPFSRRWGCNRLLWQRSRLLSLFGRLHGLFIQM